MLMGQRLNQIRLICVVCTLLTGVSLADVGRTARGVASDFGFPQVAEINQHLRQGWKDSEISPLAIRRQKKEVPTRGSQMQQKMPGLRSLPQRVRPHACRTLFFTVESAPPSIQTHVL